MGIRDLPEDLRKETTAEVNEGPQRITTNLDIIKEWLSKQPHINARTDDQWLLAFIRSCKYRLERVKEKLDNFYTLKTAYPEMFCARDPFDDAVQNILKTGAILPLDKPGLKKTRVILMRTGLLDPEHFSKVPIVLFMILELMMLEDDYFNIGGLEMVLDCSKIGLDHVKQLTPTYLKKFFTIALEGLPIKIKGSHYVNTLSILETYFNLMKSFMSEKIKNRTTISSQNVEVVFEKIPKEIFPAEYGGNSGTVQDIIDKWKTKMENNKNWYLENIQHKTYENKRPNKTKVSNYIFGIEGTFRELTVD